MIFTSLKAGGSSVGGAAGIAGGIGEGGSSVGMLSSSLGLFTTFSMFYVFGVLG